MGAADRAVDLDSAHKEAAVLRLDVVIVGGRPEARPSAAGVVLGVGGEEGCVAGHATVDALLFVVVVLTAEGPLCTLHPRHVVLLGGELVLPLFFRLLYLPWRISHTAILARQLRRLLSTLRPAASAFSTLRACQALAFRRQLLPLRTCPATPEERRVELTARGDAPGRRLKGA